MENISARNMWAGFLDTLPKSPIAEAPRPIQFFDLEKEADQHAEMALVHTKKAASYPLLALQSKKEPLPKIGSFLIVLDGTGHAKCLVRIASMTLKPLFSIKEDFVRLEGFNDLEQWKRVQGAYFSRELSAYGRTVKDSMIVVCITFEKVYG